MQLAVEKGYHSIAFPLIGAGTGGVAAQKSLDITAEEAEQSNFDGKIVIVKFKKA